MKHGHLQALFTYLGLNIQEIADNVLVLPINNLIIDSRKIQLNDIFIALKGHHVDGRNYIDQAVLSGAVAVLCESDSPQQDKQIRFYHSAQNQCVPVVYLAQLSERLSAIAGFFYQQPSKQMTLVGVTGTNGKTTITQLLAQYVQLLGEKSAVMGTIGNGLYGQLTPSQNTTMSAVEVQATLASFVAQQVQFTAMEVSSHGLVEHRVAGLYFSATIFSNLSRDHLDYHGSMEAYAQAKWSLFDPQHAAVAQGGIAVINADDEVGRQWLLQCPDSVAFSVNSENYSFIKTCAYYMLASQISYHNDGLSLMIDSSWGQAQLETQLIGQFNVQNLLAVLGTLLALGYPLNQLVAQAQYLRPVQGRMEMFVAAQKPLMIVDYAHTPDALMKALEAARLHCQGKLWVIFGCGGDRDRGKRPLMARVAQDYADNVMITSDNPRTENEQQIIDDIAQGLLDNKSVWIELDREKAIAQVFALAQHDDTILVAGKGHEDYQIIGDQKRYYSDRQTVANLLGVIQ
ncbi:UDP-N-acetylmuramoyl-L-alanyl-D-glutamate--2,6-diaminopimelate ligase [Utexia brackfieldae]|uniref:UDP-N-acetylmuramoyl-L-alanyl-D-glutamate--2, 6-diaminopimelate ligase n=1 Tax=Utexia brackfieldae TaxID=3074108 RepID=UPI00370D8982